MRLPSVPDPRLVLAEVAGLLPRLVAVLGAAEDLVAQARVVVRRVDETRAAADDVVERVAETRAAAGDVVERVDATAVRADGLVVRLEPSVVALLPTLERLASTVSPEEVDALVALIDTLPRVSTAMTAAMPVLESLETVAPDLHDLLDASRELNELLGHLPGMGRARKKVEEGREETGAAEPDPAPVGVVVAATAP